MFFSASLEQLLIKQGSALWSKSLQGITEALGLPMGQRGWSGGQPRQQRDGIVVLVATTQTSLKGPLKPMSKKQNKFSGKPPPEIYFLSISLGLRKGNCTILT